MKTREPVSRRLPENPIFIVGYPRSGTTLMQSLLSALATRPPIFSFPETHYFNVLEKRLLTGEIRKITGGSIRDNLALIREKSGLPPDREAEDMICRQAGETGMSSRDFFEWIVIRNLGEHLKPEIWNHGFRWAEKTPYHANFIERILLLYRDARILHILRHPVAAVTSQKRNFPFCADTPLEELARRWVNVTGNALRAMSRYPDKVLTLRYEDLVKNPKKILDEIAGFINVPLDIRLLDRLPSSAASVILDSEPWKANNKRDGLHDANNDCRKRISADESKRIEKVAAERMAETGYGDFFGNGSDQR